MIQDMSPTYTISNGLRRVLPYYFYHKTPFKPRWKGKTVVEVLVSELGQSVELVERGVRAGTVYLSENNGRAGGPSVIKGSDVFTRRLTAHDVIHNAQHVHEPSIPWQPNKNMRTSPVSTYNGQAQSASNSQNALTVLYQNSDMVVVAKPAGVPTHPSGIYRYNTLLEIVTNELGVPVWPCHRLDKLTLGIVVFAKTKQFCKDMMGIFASHKSLEKVYLARVKGNFPDYRVFLCPLVSINSSGSGYLNVPEQIAVSTTHFQKSAYLPETDESIVLCRPLTGKMHQIRIHLSLLGHPISNDRYYNGEDEVNRKKQAVEREIYDQIFEKYPQFSPKLSLVESSEKPALVSVSDFVTRDIRAKISEVAGCRKSKDHGLITGKCQECLAPLYAENPDVGIYLHAFKLTYKRLQIEYENLHTRVHSFEMKAELPFWCPADDI